MRGLERVRLLAQARDNGIAEFLGVDLLLASAFLENIVSVNAVLKQAFMISGPIPSPCATVIGTRLDIRSESPK